MPRVMAASIALMIGAASVSLAQVMQPVPFSQPASDHQMLFIGTEFVRAKVVGIGSIKEYDGAPTIAASVTIAVTEVFKTQRGTKVGQKIDVQIEPRNSGGASLNFDQGHPWFHFTGDHLTAEQLGAVFLGNEYFFSISDPIKMPLRATIWPLDHGNWIRACARSATLCPRDNYSLP